MTNARLGVYIVKEARRDHPMEIFYECAVREYKFLKVLRLEIDVFRD